MNQASQSGRTDFCTSPQIPNHPVIPVRTSHFWFALQIRVRYERVVAAHLAAKRFEWFLPLYKHRTRWSDRYKARAAALPRIRLLSARPDESALCFGDPGGCGHSRSGKDAESYQ